MAKAHAKISGPEYTAWSAMIQRCTNPTNRAYAGYGGRGITVCPEWLGSFDDFFAHIGKRPTAAHSLDRFPDNNGNYRPGNVRWATSRQQRANQRLPSKKTPSRYRDRTFTMLDATSDLIDRFAVKYGRSASTVLVMALGALADRNGMP